MATAEIWAKRSTCQMLHVGAVFSRGGRILAQGYNGAPAGLDHCDHKQWRATELAQIPSWLMTAMRQLNPAEQGFSITPGMNYFWDGKCLTIQPAEQIRPTCSISEHAERNGIAWAARNGVRLEGSELHVTDTPCLQCAMAVVNSGVERVVYLREYRIKAGLELLTEAGIEVLHFDALSDKVAE